MAAAGLGLRGEQGQSGFQPLVHIFHQGLGAHLAHLAAFLGGTALNLSLDLVERGGALHGFGGNGQLASLHQVVKLTPNVGEARRFLNGAAFVRLVEPRENVALSHNRPCNFRFRGISNPCRC
jgi:hypothetical protein